MRHSKNKCFFRNWYESNIQGSNQLVPKCGKDIQHRFSLTYIMSDKSWIRNYEPNILLFGGNLLKILLIHIVLPEKWLLDFSEVGKVWQPLLWIIEKLWMPVCLPTVVGKFLTKKRNPNMHISRFHDNAIANTSRY